MQKTPKNHASAAQNPAQSTPNDGTSDRVAHRAAERLAEIADDLAAPQHLHFQVIDEDGGEFRGAVECPGEKFPGLVLYLLRIAGTVAELLAELAWPCSDR